MSVAGYVVAVALFTLSLFGAHRWGVNPHDLLVAGLAFFALGHILP